MGRCVVHALFTSTIGVTSGDPRLATHLAVCVLVGLPSDVAHHTLLAWAHSAVVPESWHVALAVEATDLQLAKLNVEVGDEIFENVATLCHQLRCLLVSQDLLYVLLGSLEVREQKDENFLGVARDFHQVDGVADLMEVSVEDLSAHLDT